MLHSGQATDVLEATEVLYGYVALLPVLLMNSLKACNRLNEVTRNKVMVGGIRVSTMIEIRRGIGTHGSRSKYGRVRSP